MRSRMPIVIRIFSWLIGVGLFVGSNILILRMFKTFEAPNLTVFIVLSAIFLLLSFILPLICRRKILLLLLIFSTLTLALSSVVMAAKEPIQEALYETQELVERYEEEIVNPEDYVSDPTTASLTADQAKFRADLLRNGAQGSSKSIRFDRSYTRSYRDNRRTELYGYDGDRYEDTRLARKKVPDPLESGKKLVYYSEVLNRVPSNTSNDYGYWVNGTYGFVEKRTSSGIVGDSHYTLDQYTYFNDDGLVAKQAYRIFVFPSENSDEIYDYQEVYKYELQLPSK